MDVKMAIGAAIKDARLSRGLSQTTLAENADISVNRLRQIEQGEANITVDTLSKLLMQLGLDLGRFFTSLKPSPGDAVDSPAKSTQTDEASENALYNGFLCRAMYPPPLPYSVNTVHSLLELIVYLPLFDPLLFADALKRIGASVIGNEAYVLSQLDRVAQSIPQGPALTFARSVVENIEKYRNVLETNDSEGISDLRSNPIMEGYADYLKSIDCYANIAQSIAIIHNAYPSVSSARTTRKKDNDR